MELEFQPVIPEFLQYKTATLQLQVTLGGNRTLGASTNQVDGGVYVISVIQDGTGGRTLSFNSNYKFAGGTAPTVTSTASARDIFVFKSNGTNMFEIGRSQNVS